MEEPKSQIGDTLEMAIWYNDQHPQEYANAVKGIYLALTKTEEKYGLRLGPVDFEVLDPGDERVPKPDPKFSGTPKLLVGFAAVVKLVPVTIGEDIGFTEDLDNEALQRLRGVTQGAYLKGKPPDHPPLTDEQLDTIINEVGPEVALKTLHSGNDERRLS